MTYSKRTVCACTCLMINDIFVVIKMSQQYGATLHKVLARVYAFEYVKARVAITLIE